MAWGADTSKPKNKQKPNWGADTSKKKARGRQDRDDFHPDSDGDIWEGTRRFGSKRPRKKQPEE